jgi:ADP-ribosylglycohydrolase
VRLAGLQSLPTHGHLRSQLCCQIYCLWARRILQGISDPWASAIGTLRSLLAADPAALKELSGPIAVDTWRLPTGSGYVVDSIHSARFALQSPNFQSVVRAAIALGDDTDTTAAVAGGLAGLRFGLSGIPAHWRNGLRGQEILKPLLSGLLRRHEPTPDNEKR